MGCSTLRSNLIKINVRAAEERYPRTRGPQRRIKCKFRPFTGLRMGTRTYVDKEYATRGDRGLFSPFLPLGTDHRSLTRLFDKGKSWDVPCLFYSTLFLQFYYLVRLRPLIAKGQFEGLKEWKVIKGYVMKGCSSLLQL